MNTFYQTQLPRKHVRARPRHRKSGKLFLAMARPHNNPKLYKYHRRQPVRHYTTPSSTIVLLEQERWTKPTDIQRDQRTHPNPKLPKWPHAGKPPEETLNRERAPTPPRKENPESQAPNCSGEGNRQQHKFSFITLYYYIHNNPTSQWFTLSPDKGLFLNNHTRSLLKHGSNNTLYMCGENIPIRIVPPSGDLFIVIGACVRDQTHVLILLGGNWPCGWSVRLAVQAA